MVECPKTPECDKLRDNDHDWRLINEFLEWLRGEDIFLAHEGEDGELYEAGTKNIDLEFLGVDPEKLEEERQALLDYQRSLDGDL